MTPEQFCYWLQGLLECKLSDMSDFTSREAIVVRDHLQLVFEKLTPDRQAAKHANPLDLLRPSSGDRRIC